MKKGYIHNVILEAKHGQCIHNLTVSTYSCTGCAEEWAIRCQAQTEKGTPEVLFLTESYFLLIDSKKH